MAKSVSKIVITLLLIVLLGYVGIYGLSLSGLGIPVEFYSIADEENGVRLGFDLTGGSVIVYEAENAAPTEEQLSTVVEIMYKRLSRLGYTEATVAKQGTNRVAVEIPSVTNPDEAIKILGATAQLSFVDSEGNTILTGKDVKNAKALYAPVDESGISKHYVELSLNANAQQAFFEGTTKMSQKPEGENFIAIKLDEEVYSAPRVEQPINSDTAIISGEFTADTAKELATTIKEGQLPFKLNVVERRSAGPVLGDNALKTSINAAIIGIILVMLFMIIMYRLPGIVASISLLAYMVLVMLVLVATKANLSLPGIAGIILSVGMAVDANVVIFERIKDEMRLGKTTGAAMRAGFNRALSAVIDGNITTLIVAVVLFFFGTGTIKGFAITLGIGIVVSLFTAVVLTRMLLSAIFDLNIKNPVLYGLNKKKEVAKNV